MYKTTLTVVNRFLFPVFVLFFFKILGLLVSLSIEGVKISILDLLTKFGNISIYISESDIKSINTLSDFIMYFGVFVITSFLLVYYLKFKNLFIYKIDSNLILYRSVPLLFLIKTTFVAYRKLSVWLILLAIANLLIILNYILGINDVWVVVLVSVITCVFHFLIIFDFSVELKNLRTR